MRQARIVEQASNEYLSDFANVSGGRIAAS
jgi:hypothetical protein